MVLAAVAAVSASAAEFSHKLHLAMELACEKCHTAARGSTKASDNLLPSPAVCRECHQEGQPVRSAPAPQFVAKFNHALHLKMGNVAPVIAAAIDKGTYLSAPGTARAQLNTRNPCEACHRGLRESDGVAKANFPAMADCLVCHNQIDVPFSCTQCHLETQPLRPSTHTADFLDVHSSGRMKLDKTTCAVCHGRRFTCQGCH
jgi:hypothetical protein